MNKIEFLPASCNISFTPSIPLGSPSIYYAHLPTRAEAIYHLSGRLLEFGQLPENWNGYYSKRVPQAVIDNAIATLDEIGRIGGASALPEVRPQSLGLIALKWKNDSGEAYIEIGETRFSGYIELANGKTYFLQGDARQSKLNALLSVYERLFSPGEISPFLTVEVDTTAYPTLASSVSLSGEYSSWGGYSKGGFLSLHDPQEPQDQIGNLRANPRDQRNFYDAFGIHGRSEVQGQSSSDGKPKQEV